MSWRFSCLSFYHLIPLFLKQISTSAKTRGGFSYICVCVCVCVYKYFFSLTIKEGYLAVKTLK